jgi:uncharacterized protein
MEYRYYISVEDSIAKILNTPRGSRVMRPEYGSLLHELIDRRFDEEWKLDAVGFVYDAIEKWEKRIKLKKIIPEINNGKISIEVIYEDIETGKNKNYNYVRN